MTKRLEKVRLCWKMWVSELVSKEDAIYKDRCVHIRREVAGVTSRQPSGF